MVHYCIFARISIDININVNGVVICVADVIEVGMKYPIDVNVMISTDLLISANILPKFVAVGVPAKVLRSLHS